jgi:hypothetical protein
MLPISPVPALALLYFYVSTLRSMCAVPNMAVFCSSVTSWFPGMLLTYLLLLLLLFVIAFMHGIYNYIPETNHVSRVHNVAAFL